MNKNVYILKLPLVFSSLINSKKDKVIKPIKFEEESNITEITETLDDLDLKSVKYNFKEIKENRSINDRIYDIDFNSDEKTNERTNNSNGTIPKDIACFWCCHKFDGLAVSAPYKYDDINDTFKCEGIFCSFSCCFSGSLSGILSRKNFDISLLKLLYRRIFNLKITDPVSFKRAPDRKTLQFFGGVLTIEQFRNVSNLKNNEIHKFSWFSYPMIFMNKELQYRIERPLKSIKGSAITTHSINASKQRLKNQSIEDNSGYIKITDLFIKA